MVNPKIARRIRGQSKAHPLPLLPSNFEIIYDEGPEDPHGIDFLLESIKED